MGSNQYTQLLKNLATGMLSLTGAMVFLVGAWVLVSAFSSVPTPEFGSRRNSRIIADANQTGQRNPSSIMPAELPLKINKSIPSPVSNETLVLGCLRDGMKIEMKSAAKRVRLKARFCDGLVTALDESSIVNRANGFEATLFNLENGGLSSDYISLASGPNQLLFQIANSNGDHVVGEVTVLRLEGK